MKITLRLFLFSASVMGTGLLPFSTVKAEGSVSSIQVKKPQTGVKKNPSSHKAVAHNNTARNMGEAGNGASKNLRSYRSRHAEEMTVTGSYLATSKSSNPNPVQTITSKQIMQTGVTNLGDMLQRMPSVGSSGNTNSTPGSVAGAASCTDLRNLGYNRVLVLVDGKRMAMDAQANCVDMNTIPIQLVQNVEILKDGSSELYGADAVSGVINIKLRHNVNDGNIMVRGGITGHGDGKTGMISGYKGWNFDEGRGNVTFYGSYNTTEGIRQKNRSWATPVQQDLNGQVFGSRYAPDPWWTDANGNTLGKKPGRYDFSREQFLTQGVNTGSLYGDAHYDFNRHFTLYSNVLYSHSNGLSQSAPEPWQGSIPPSTYPSAVTVPGDYPGNPFGQDATMSTRRYMEFGNRRSESASDTYTAKAGLKGEIYWRWMYDASFTYGWNQSTQRSTNSGDYSKLLNVYGLRPTMPGNADSGLAYDPSLCPSFGCSSPFSPLSTEAAAYANANTTLHSYYQLRDWNLRIHRNDVLTMPWEHGGRLGIAFGFEHRGEQLAMKPDELTTSGRSMMNYSSYTGGGFNVSEGYLEGNLNLLKNAWLAKDLTIDGQARVSGYNTFGSTKNWKSSINWMPVRDVHFKGTLGTSFRQPNVQEMYQGSQLAYDTAKDPMTGAYEQVPVMIGGNANLRPETSRTYTFGVELTPRWIKRLVASVEYWHTTLNNTIGTLPTQYILNQCAESGNLCNNVQRYSNGRIQQITEYNTNVGTWRTGGLDLDLNYSLPLTEYDVLSLNNTIQQVISYQQQQVPGGQFYNYDGRLLYQNNGGNGSVPRFRDYATFTWRHGHFSATYMMQYMSGMRWNDTTVDLTSADVRHHSTPGMFQHDLTLAYNLGKWNFEGGIQNIANKRPPFVPSGSNNTAGNLYGNFFPGRYFFMQAGLNF